MVGDVKQTSLALSEPDAFYVTPTQWSWVDNVQSLVVRTHGDAAALAPAIRSAIWSVDKNQPIVRVATMDNLLASSEAQRRFALILFEAFALVALVLAATGMYGVLAGSVTERMREIGIRAALGASRGDILALVVRQGMTLTALRGSDRANGRFGCEPGSDHTAVRYLTARPGHLSRRDRATGSRVSDRVRLAGMACGAGRSFDHIARGIAVAQRCHAIPAC